MNVYLVSTKTQNHEIPQDHVLPWLRGYCACMADAGSTVQLVSELCQLPGESIHQTCLRVLTTCHDQRILTYTGVRIRQERS